MGTPSWSVPDRVLVRFVEDPALLCERLIVREGEGGRYIVVDGERRASVLQLKTGSKLSEIIAWPLDAAKLPAGVKSKGCLLAEHAGRGAFSKGGITSMVKRYAGPVGDELLSTVEPAQRLRKKTSLKDVVDGADTTGADGSGDKEKDKDGVWLMCEPGGGLDTGVEASGGSFIFKDSLHGLYRCSDKSVVRVQAVGVEDATEWQTARQKFLCEKLKVESGLEDARTIAVAFNSLGQRGRRFEDSVLLMDPQDFDDWPLEKPRTVAYCLREEVKLGVNANARHLRWVAENKLAEDDANVMAHEVLAEIETLAVEYDQLDLTNSAAFERMFRWRQNIEESQRQSMEEKRQAKGGKDLSSALSQHFAGRPRMAGGAIISPALLKSAAENAAQENEILRQQRKAAEVRGLLKDKKGKS